ncbi:MAG TPA: hypothetical protein VLE73_03760 [Candidatus Saccharimonadales bacterium]|nr:hypothetical protein [Candidatus Saccharimonadales bacterium]
MAFIISADELKKTLPGYEPARSDEFHQASAKLADQTYDRAIKERSENEVILLSGGAASGKTEYLSVYLDSQEIIVLDGTLPSFEGAKIKIRKAIKRGKHVSVTAVMPEDFNIAFSAFLGREREFPPEHFFRTHSSSRKTLLEIAEKLPDIDITIIDSEYDSDGGLHFTEIIFSDKTSMVELLRQRQYTEAEIRNKIFHAT